MNELQPTGASPFEAIKRHDDETPADDQWLQLRERPNDTMRA